MTQTTKFLVSDENVNEYGFRLLTSGILTTRFQNNPVGFYNHERNKGVICKWSQLQKYENGSVSAIAEFDIADELGNKIAGKVERGFIKAASVGINILAISDDPALMLPGQTLPTVTQCELIEISIVDVPANRNALALYDGNGARIELTSGSDIQLYFSNHHKPLNMLKLTAKTITALGLSDNPTAEQIESAVEVALKDALDTKAALNALKQEQEQQLRARVENLCSQAVKSKKITEAEKAEYLQLGMLNLPLLEKTLARLQAPNLPASSIRREGNVATATKSLRELAAGKSLRDLEKTNQKLVLRIRREDPDFYNELYTAQYGVEAV